MNLAGHLGILSAKNSTDQTWRGILSLGGGSRLPRGVGGSPSSSASPRNRTCQAHWLGGGTTRRDGLHVEGLAVEETLLPLVSALAAGRRTQAKWCWMTTTWL